MFRNLQLHDLHARLSATFASVGDLEVVNDYGDWAAEHRALRESAGVLDLSFRSRLCLLGKDRVEFLHGQVTNEITGLPPGQGCYAALVNAKGKMQSDLYVYRLPDELLLDFEPGLTEIVRQRLEKYVVAAEVEIMDVAPHYSLWSVQGPRSAAAIESLGLDWRIPTAPLQFAEEDATNWGKLYLVNQPRLGTQGFDLFIPNDHAQAIAEKLIAAARGAGGGPAGWTAFDTARIEAGIPRFSVDMDETNLVPEAGIEAQAVSYTKGCYIGQEVIARIRTYGQVAKSLRRLSLPQDLNSLPVKGDKLLHEGKEVGWITSAVRSPSTGECVALGYVRREVNQPGSVLHLLLKDAEPVEITVR